MIRVALAGGVAFLISAGLIRALLSSSHVRRRILAAPVAHRWHTAPTPSLGGVPMFVAFAGAVLVTGGFDDPVVRGLLIACGLVCGVGLVDDLIDISPLTKLVGQFVGAFAVITIAGGSALLSFSFALLTVPWMVLISNSVNLIDNMDGLAGSTTAITLLTLLPVILGAGQLGLALAAAAVVGAVAGFLVFNINPAKVFMGDAGSLWLGLVLAATVALADYGDRRLIPLVAATVLAVPLLDTATVVVSRLRHKLSVMRGGSDHLSHRLVRLGLTDRQSVLILATVTAVCGVAGGLATLSVPTWLMTVGLLWTCLLGVVAILLRVPVYEENASFGAGAGAPRGKGAR